MKKFILIFLSIFATNFNLPAQAILTDRHGVAVNGYDLVSYFIDKNPMKGNSKINVNHKGSIYYFVNEQNKQLFLESPESYLPAYGGYCAYAVARGYTAKIDPLQWIVFEGRLFLNFSRHTQRVFTKNISDMVESANANWPTIKKKLTLQTES